MGCTYPTMGSHWFWPTAIWVTIKTRYNNGRPRMLQELRSRRSAAIYGWDRPLLGFTCFTSVVQWPWKKREPFLGKTTFSGAATKKMEKGCHWTTESLTRVWLWLIWVFPNIELSFLVFHETRKPTILAGQCQCQNASQLQGPCLK